MDKIGEKWKILYNCEMLLGAKLLWNMKSCRNCDPKKTQALSQ